ncbi:DHA2 family efflux MFS transporter permease subunit [Paramicrobacterium fandaimingii]|uniref:DHA2 family efflux MFS transporter permease subunit n=1 Tax=Paramicrobacterium fandaimingii TaxID=2708079 RepID=UPI001F24AFF7|nr:DHA2 family efflux MFS transporter permease subunit [Microbacterium fandaimingii]
MTTTPMPTGTAQHLPRAAVRTLAALIVGGAAAILDTTIVTIALDKLSTDLHSTPTTIQWVVTAYLLALVAAIPLSGWAQSTFGGKRAWMATLTIFVIFSAASAFAWSDTSLIVFRALQGFGAGLIFPLMQTLAVQAIGKASTKVMATTIAAISVPLALGPIVGPVLGGILLSSAGWRSLFLINVPLVAVGLVMAWRLIAPDAPRAAHRTRVDLTGLALLIPSLVGIVLGLSNVASDGGFWHTDVLVPLILGVALIMTFVVWALRRGSHAAVDISLLRLRSLATSSGTLFTAGATMFSGMFLLPLYWQQVRGDSVLTAALVLVPQGVGALLARLVASKLAAQFGARALTTGAFLVTALATVPFAVADADTNGWWLGGALFVRGLGVGAVIMAPMMVAYADVEHNEMPHATMLTRITQQIGASFGVAVVAVVLQNSVATDVTAGFQTAFWWLIGITVLALVPAIAFRRESLDKDDSVTRG